MKTDSQGEKEPLKDIAKRSKDASFFSSPSASSKVSVSGVVTGNPIPLQAITAIGSGALSVDGDLLERRYAPLFLNSKFPAYEQFWKKHVIPLTKRDHGGGNIHFKTDAELELLGKGPEDIHMAQIHYTGLRHLARVYDLKQSSSRENFFDGILRLVSAVDVAYELLGRHTNRGRYEPFRWDQSKAAREAWRASQNSPFEKLHRYRNAMVHGSMLPEIHGPVVYAPRIGSESDYSDWRKVTDAADTERLSDGDFLPASEILSEAWSDVVAYCQTEWMSHLV